jgi:tetratricopeptide (TPR) repeat protein
MSRSRSNEVQQEREAQVRSHCRRGQRVAAAGLERAAVREYQRALRLDGENVEAYLGLAETYRLQDRMEEALRAYSQALRRAPNQAEGHLGMAELMINLGRPQAASRHLTEAIKLDEDRAYLRYRLGQMYLRDRDYRGAREHLQHAVALAPWDGFYHFKLAEVHFAQRDYPQAGVEYEAAVACSRLDDLYHVRLAAAYCRLRLRGRALAALARALEIRPDNAVYRCLLADQLVRMGREQEAEQHYLQAGRLRAYDRDCLEKARRRFGRRIDER